VSLEDEVSVPDRSLLRPLAENVGLEAERGSEHRQRRERHRELLRRGGRERHGRVLGEHRLPRRELDGQGTGLARPDVGDAERAREALLERGIGAGLRRPDAGERERDEERDDDGRQAHGDSVEGHPHAVKEDGPRRRRR
jgi:hypothetical protein